MTLDVHDILETVTSRTDFVAFVRALIQDFRNNRDEWESWNLDDYLQALADSSEGMDQLYKNRGDVVPEEPSWMILAEMLLAAKYYE